MRQQPQRAPYATQKNGAAITPMIPEKADDHPHQEVQHRNKKKEETDQGRFRGNLQIIIVCMIDR